MRKKPNIWLKKNLDKSTSQNVDDIRQSHELHHEHHGKREGEIAICSRNLNGGQHLVVYSGESYFINAIG